MLTDAGEDSVNVRAIVRTPPRYAEQLCLSEYSSLRIPSTCREQFRAWAPKLGIPPPGWTVCPKEVCEAGLKEQEGFYQL